MRNEKLSNIPVLNNHNSPGLSSRVQVSTVNSYLLRNRAKRSISSKWMKMLICPELHNAVMKRYTNLILQFKKNEENTLQINEFEPNC